MLSLWKKIKDWYYVASGRAEIDAVIESFRQGRQADRLKRGVPADLEGYHHKFKRNLLGNWLTINSEFFYHGPVPTTQWQFFEDGTAIEMTSSGSGSYRTHYQWRELDDFAIQLLTLDSEIDEYLKEEWKIVGAEEDDDEEEPSRWFRLSYDFKSIESEVVLFSTPEHETFKFGMCDEYLEFQGDHPKEKREE